MPSFLQQDAENSFETKGNSQVNGLIMNWSPLLTIANGSDYYAWYIYDYMRGYNWVVYISDIWWSRGLISFVNFKFIKLESINTHVSRGFPRSTIYSLAWLCMHAIVCLDLTQHLCEQFDACYSLTNNRGIFMGTLSKIWYPI